MTGTYDRRGFEYLHGARKNHVDFFFKWLEGFFSGQKKRYTHVVAAHNLKFDLGVLLWPMLNPLGHALPGPKESRFSYGPRRATVFISWRKPCFARVTFRDTRDSILIVDTFSFFPFSLKNILKTIGGEDQKEEKPEGLGERVIPVKECVPYNRADCVGVYRILEFLEDQHRAFDVRFSVSLPQFASRVFRHKFLKENFKVPPPGAIYGALYSYHGGKNTWTGKAGWHQAFDLDIRSAFPKAMLELPNFSSGTWRRSKTPPTHFGLYLIRGTLRNCRWGSLFSHSFKKLSGKIGPIWTTGPELLEAISSRELTNHQIIDGWEFVPEGNSETPFKAFVDHFYRAKETAQTKISRQFFKLILNSLYGKFIQKTEDEFSGELNVGGLFDPCVASLITGFVRAWIHKLEHKYQALHTATDGILTTKKPDPKDLGDEIGKLKCENFGPCLIVRNKLYLHYDLKGNLVKRGLHGFQGSPEELLKLWKEKRKYYTIDRLSGWAESWRGGIQPGLKILRKMQLNYKRG